MILITVGTTMPFDELLAEVDSLADRSVFDEEILCQYGQSTYRMKNGSQFKARPRLDDLIEQSSLVITHGGSTVIQLIHACKPFVAFPNPRGAGDHQTEFLKRLSGLADISWSANVADLARLYSYRRQFGHAKVRDEVVRAASLIKDFI
jgi:UDP-N-acetylglucosamine transferase subunit ALG13